MPNLEVVSAFERTPLATLPYADAAAAEAMLQRAFALYSARGAWLTREARLAVLGKLATLVRDQAETLAQQVAKEGGKPLMDARVELLRAVDGIGIAAAELRSLAGKEIPMGLNAASAGRMAYTYYEPRGVVLAISAFNHPFNLCVHQVVTAVAAGCPVLIKPALTTPLSCRSLVNLLLEAGLPEGWCQLLIAEHEVVEALVRDARVAFLSFVGSAKVGWALRRQLAAGSACALEHGGVAPAIVEASADLDRAVPALVKGGYYHAGQVCVSVQRVFVDQRVLQPFLARFVPAVAELKVGDPSCDDTAVGPLILPREVQRVEQWVSDAVAEGATCLVGGKRLSETCYAPTVLSNPKATSRVSREEVFGPLVCIYGYDNIDDAVERANLPDAYFQAALFTESLSVALDLGKRLHGTAVMVNDHSAFRVDWMPFSGHRASGLGIGGIAYALRELCVERMIVFKQS